MGKELLSDSKQVPPDSSYSPSNDGKKFTKEEKEKLKRRERKQRRKQNLKARRGQAVFPEDGGALAQDSHPEKSNVEIEYVERDEYLLTGKYYEEFKNVFQYFATPKLEKFSQKQDYEDHYSNPDEGNNNAGFDNDNDGAVKEQTKKTKEVKLSRKKRKQLKMLKVAQLKALVKRPDVVEVPSILNFRIFILSKGLGRNFAWPFDPRLSQILQKHCARTQTLVPKTQVPSK